MKIYGYTRWVDKIRDNLQEVENILNSKHEDEVSSMAMSYIGWRIQEKIHREESEVGNQKIVYDYSVHTNAPSEVEDNLRFRSGFLIVYMSEHDERVHYIMSRNSDALVLLRKMLRYSDRKVIEKEELGISDNIFLWLISKVYNKESCFSLEGTSDNALNIEAVRGFKGDTEDSLTKVTTEGETVINIISTLSFIIESKKLKQITIDVSYQGHDTIEIVLHQKTVAIIPEKYVGILNGYEQAYIISKLVLLLYFEILPIIKSKYQAEVDARLWGQRRTVEFLSQVASVLIEKVNEKISFLHNEPEQLALDFDTLFKDE